MKKNDVYEEYPLDDFIRLFPELVEKLRRICPVDLLLRSRSRYVVRVYPGRISIISV